MVWSDQRGRDPVLIRKEPPAAAIQPQPILRPGPAANVPGAPGPTGTSGGRQQVATVFDLTKKLMKDAPEIVITTVG